MSGGDCVTQWDRDYHKRMTDEELDLKCQGNVLVRRPIDRDADIILAEWGHSYVTWVQSRETGGCSWGHYFEGATGLSQAAKSFEERLEKLRKGRAGAVKGLPHSKMKGGT